MAAVAAMSLFLAPVAQAQTTPATRVPVVTGVPPQAPVADGAASAAAGWVGRQVQAGDGLFEGRVNYLPDAIFSLAAAGVGKDVIDDAAQQLLSSGSAYVGAPEELQAKSSPIAKTALALQIAGVDPTKFPASTGTRDLIADLGETLNQGGTFGSASYTYPFAQAVPILALARSASGAPKLAVDWLLAQQCTEEASPQYGSFYSYGSPKCEVDEPDSTSISVQALLAAGVPATTPSIVAAQNWLIAAQSADGDVAGNSNSTGLAGQTFLALGDSQQAEAAAGYIAGLQLTCDAVNIEQSSVTAADVGAITYDADGVTDAVANGVAGNLTSIQYGTMQAIFGLGALDLGSLSASGSQAALPAAPDCTPVVPSVPASFTLNASSGSSGDVIPFTGSGFSSAEQVTVTLNSTPIDLGSVTADANGNITGSFTVPAAAEVGDHSVVVAGVSSGLSASAAFTVRAAAAVEPAPAVVPDPVAGPAPAPAANADFTPAATKPGDLAATGVTSATMPLLTTSGVLLLLGAALLVSARNRRSENI